MTYHDAVMDYMRRDPGREYRAREITLGLFPELADDRDALESRRNSITTVLRSAERYGFVQRRRPVANGGDYWRLIQ